MEASEEKPVKCLAVTLVWPEGKYEQRHFCGISFKNGQVRNFPIGKIYLFSDINPVLMHKYEKERGMCDGACEGTTHRTDIPMTYYFEGMHDVYMCYPEAVPSGKTFEDNPFLQHTPGLLMTDVIHVTMTTIGDVTVSVQEVEGLPDPNLKSKVVQYNYDCWHGRPHCPGGDDCICT